MRGWWIWAIVLMLGVVGCSKKEPTSAAAGVQKVTLTLNWVPEPEFGGIYAAKLSGAFQRNHLDVDIRPGGAGTPTWQMVATGQADFAVASADEVIIARTKGADVVAIFATYQTCPQGIMVHASRGLKTIGDVCQSSTLAVEPGLAYVDYLKGKFGIDKGKLVPYTGGIAAFLADKNLAQQCFITSEPISAKRQGADPQVFLIADAGYNPYTAVVITQGEMIRSRPQVAAAVVQALREGWRSYLDDPTPANQVMGQLNKQMDADMFAEAATAQKPLIDPPAGTFACQCQFGAPWIGSGVETLIQQLLALKVIDRAPAPDECFINPPSQFTRPHVATIGQPPQCPATA